MAVANPNTLSGMGEQFGLFMCQKMAIAASTWLTYTHHQWRRTMTLLPQRQQFNQRVWEVVQVSLASRHSCKTVLHVHTRVVRVSLKGSVGDPVKIYLLQVKLLAYVTLAI